MFNIAVGGSLTDWIDTNTITNADVIRPVITVNGNIERSLRAEDRAAAFGSHTLDGLTN